MKRILCCLAVLALMSATSLPVEAKMVWKFSTFFDEDHALTRGALKFKEEVEKKHGDQIEINIYPLSQLGDGREVLEGVQVGTIELAEAGTPWAASFSNAFFPLNMPYLFLTREAAYKILDGDLGKRMAEHFEKTAGVKLMGYWENGIRHVTNNKRAVKTPEDLKDLKIRVQQDPTQIAIFRALGANPTPMAFGEVFTALQQNVIDGQENPFANIVQRKFYEVQKYLSTTAHLYDVTGFYMNLDLFEELDPELQKDLMEAAAVATKHQREQAAIQDERYLQRLRDYGKIEITLLSLEELVPFKKACAGVYKEVEDMVAKTDKEYAKIIPEMLEEIAKIESK